MSVVLTFGCAQHQGLDNEREDRVTSSWKFEQLEPQVYTPANWPEAQKATVYRPMRTGLLPAVLVVHGGGWARRSPTDMTRISQVLASKRFVAVNVAYRLAPAHLYPAPLHDLKQALDWMVENAAALQIDPERIGAFGYSAGAHLVSLLAVTETGDDPTWNTVQRGHRLKAVVAGGIPADLTRWPKSPLVNQFLGESLAESPALWTEASPIAHITPSTPPFFLYHGGLDKLVEVDQALSMKQKLDEVGVHAELFTVPYHGHLSMFLLNRSAVHRGVDFLQQRLE